MRVCALTTDLLDRSRIAASIPDVRFETSPEACTHADVVIIDLTRGAGVVARARAAAPAARIMCFGPHVDAEAASAARGAGADVVLPRSRFFRDPSAAIASRNSPRQSSGQGNEW